MRRALAALALAATLAACGTKEGTVAECQALRRSEFAAIHDNDLEAALDWQRQWTDAGCKDGGSDEPTGLHNPTKLETAIATQVPAFLREDPELEKHVTCTELDDGTFICHYVEGSNDWYNANLHATVSADGQTAEITGDSFDTQQVTA